MVNKPNLVFTSTDVLKAPATLEAWQKQYDACVDAFGKHSKELAWLFAEAGKRNYPLQYVPTAILSYATQTGDFKPTILTAREVADYYKSHPAIAKLNRIDGKLDTFLPFRLAGIACAIYAATGEEPSVDRFPINEGKDIITMERGVYLMCYGPNAVAELKEYYERRKAK